MNAYTKKIEVDIMAIIQENDDLEIEIEKKKAEIGRASCRERV